MRFYSANRLAVARKVDVNVKRMRVDYRLQYVVALVFWSSFFALRSAMQNIGVVVLWSLIGGALILSGVALGIPLLWCVAAYLLLTALWSAYMRGVFHFDSV